MKKFINACDYERDCVRLARKVYDSPWQPDLILALWRGGSVPGMIMSEVFNYYGREIKHIIIKCSSYTDRGKHGNVVFEGADEILSEIKPGARIIVVDDIFDTGTTAQEVYLRLKNFEVKFAMVYYKPGANTVKLRPDFLIHETNEWIEFPHELVGLTPDELKQKDRILADILLD